MKLTKADYEQCLQTILTVANELEVDCADINMTSRLDNMGYSGHLMFRTIPKSVEDILEIRVAVMGNVVWTGCGGYDSLTFSLSIMHRMQESQQLLVC